MKTDQIRKAMYRPGDPNYYVVLALCNIADSLEKLAENSRPFDNIAIGSELKGSLRPTSFFESFNFGDD